MRSNGSGSRICRQRRCEGTGPAPGRGSFCFNYYLARLEPTIAKTIISLVETRRCARPGVDICINFTIRKYPDIITVGNPKVELPSLCDVQVVDIWLILV
jgi:hypothetical protein